MLANALLNSINANIDEEKLIIFMSLADMYTTAHIKILNFFNNPRKFPNIDEKRYMMGSPTTVLQEVYPEVMSLVDRCFKDLYNDNLLDTHNGVIDAMMTTQGMLSKRTTELGDEFLEFISKK